ncbi:MAG: alpha/beta hydrolase [Proteobacteria bacterium]|nr:alpha/beta hydrolase [Pseudomonadota bacterium]
METSFKPKRSLLQDLKSAVSGALPDADNMSRNLRLHFLNTVVWPAKRVTNSDAVGFAEKQIDQTVAKVFREALHKAGLKSCRSDNTHGQLHYYDSHPDSREPPVVMIHGIGSSGQCFALLALMMMNKRRVVLPDLFHFSGFSSPNNPVMNRKEHTAALKEFISGLSDKPVDIVGLSLGGWLGMSLAVGSPALVNSLTLLNPAGLEYRTHALRDTLVYLSWSKFHSLYPGIMTSFPYSGLPIVNSIIKRSVYRVLKEDGVRDFVKTVHQHDFLDKDLSRIQCKTLLMWGMQDKLLSPEIPLQLVSAIPNCQGYWVRDAAHILCLEAPVNVFDCLVRFLDLERFEDNNFVSLVRGTHRVYPMQAISAQESDDR